MIIERHVDLDDLRAQMVRRTATFCAFAGFFVIWANLPVYPYPFASALPAGLLILIGIAVLRWYRQRPLLLQIWLVLGLNLCFLLALVLLPEPWLPFLSLLMIPVIMMISGAAGGFTVVLTLITVLGLEQSGLRDYPLSILLPVILAAGIVTWITSHTMYVALQWTRTMHEHSQRLLTETRQHRAELTQTLKASEIMNEVLRRTRRELIQARKQAEKAQIMKQQFAANISHELRTPLNLILGFSEIMYQSPQVYGDMLWPPRLRQDVAKIYRSSRHLLQLIDDILDLSHFEVMGFMLNLETTPISPFLHETAAIGQDLFINGAVPLHVDIAPDLPAIEIDRTRIRQVVLNLLSNARRYTVTGHVHLSAVLDRQWIVIRVEDTGIGIEPVQLEHIFEEFYQVDPSLRRQTGGAGLGLALSRKFVEAHGGYLGVESAIGCGSTFYFRLPVTTATASMRDQLHVPSGPYPCVLVWQSSPAVLNLLQRQNRDFELIPAHANLTELIQLHNPRAVLINANATLPVPDLPANLPVITFALPEQLWSEQTQNRYRHLTKPITPQQILQTLTSVPALNSILIVDDDVGFIHLVERTIQTTGRDIRVLRAYNGAEALQILRATPPDLMLLDLVMPEMSGYEVLQALANDTQAPDTHIILLTSITYAESIEQLRAGPIRIERAGGLNPAESIRYLHALIHALTPSMAAVE